MSRSRATHVPAIVMTKDSYRPFTANMIASYEELWPGHPLEFFVPYQQSRSIGSKTGRSRIKFIKTAPGFRDTVLTLLEGLGGDDWVYFCIDDKFPAWVNVPLMSGVFDRVLSGVDNPRKWPASRSQGREPQSLGRAFHSRSGSVSEFAHIKGAV